MSSGTEIAVVVVHGGRREVAFESLVLIDGGARREEGFTPPYRGDVPKGTAELPVSDPSCTFFGPNRDKFNGSRRLVEKARLTAAVVEQLPLASEVMAAFTVNAMPSAPGGSRTDTLQHSTNNIDKYLFQAMADAGVAPAPPTTDYEFVRRVTLDLTGRIPTADAVTSFVNDSNFDKRAKLVDSLMASPEWVDKWTIWFGDFLQYRLAG